jgi:hypothetical protein
MLSFFQKIYVNIRGLAMGTRAELEIHLPELWLLEVYAMKKWCNKVVGVSRPGGPQADE